MCVVINEYHKNASFVYNHEQYIHKIQLYQIRASEGFHGAAAKATGAGGSEGSGMFNVL